MTEDVYFFANESPGDGGGDGDADSDSDVESDTVNFDLMCKSPPMTERLKKQYRQRRSPTKRAQIKTDTETTDATATLDSAQAKALQHQLQQQNTVSRINSNSENAIEPAVQRRPNKHKIQQTRVQRNNSFPSLPSRYERLQRTPSLKKKNHSIRYDEKFEDIDEDLINSENIKDDAESRSQFYDKFTQILKLFIRTSANACDGMPPTPTADSIGLQKLKVLTAVTETVESNQELSPETSKTIISATKESLKPACLFEAAKMKRLHSVKSVNSENIWLDLYDFFVYYDMRFDNVDIIKERVIATRLNFSIILDEVLKIDFGVFKESMQKDLAAFRTPYAYRNLNEVSGYLIKLGILYCYIEEIINKMSYVESLYPSQKAFEAHESRYASAALRDRLKCFHLWYNIVTDLMRQCDLFGGFLGFHKRDATRQLWIWFDRNQQYSREDYARVNEKLRLAYTDLTLMSPHVNMDRQVSFELSNDFHRLPTFKTLSPPHSAGASPLILPPKLERLLSFHSMKSTESIATGLYKTVETLNGSDDSLCKISNGTSSENQSNNGEVTRDRIYRDFATKQLCKQGFKKTMEKLLNMSGITIPRACEAMSVYAKPEGINGEFFSHHWMPLHDTCQKYISKYKGDEETRKYGVNCETFGQLALPSFRPLYLFLLSCNLDLMNECMKISIDNDKNSRLDESFSLSLLSTEQLTKESRECIEHAILVRQYYYYMVFNVYEKSYFDDCPIENDLVRFDENLKQIIFIYLGHVTRLVQDQFSAESLSIFEREWNFCKTNLCFFDFGCDSYAKRFCEINSRIIESLTEYLRDIEKNFKLPLLESIRNFKSSAESSQIFLNVTENEDSEHEAPAIKVYNENNNEVENEYEYEYGNQTLEHQVHTAYNELKCEIRELRERTVKSLTFCRLFMNDLELAARYQVVTSCRDVFRDLEAKNFVLVKLHDHASHVPFLFVSSDLAADRKQILRLLSLKSARKDLNGGVVKVEPPQVSVAEVTGAERPAKANGNALGRLPSAGFGADSQKVMSALSQIAKMAPRPISIAGEVAVSGYLLYLELSDADRSANIEWRGNVLDLKLPQNVKINLCQSSRVARDRLSSYVYLVTSNAAVLNEKRVGLKTILRGHASLIKDKTSFHPNIAGELDNLHEKIIGTLREDIFTFIKTIEGDIAAMYQDGDGVSVARKPRYVLDLWRVCYNFGIELHHECTKFVTPTLAESFAKGLSEFCIKWCDYIVNKTEEGYGRTTKPCWAGEGFKLLNEAFKPNNSQYLEAEEYRALRKNVEKCIQHIIGTKRRSEPKVDVSTTKRSMSTIERSPTALRHDVSDSQLYQHSLEFSSNMSDSELPRMQLMAPRERFRLSCLEKDLEINKKRLNRKLIGKEVKYRTRMADVNINVKRVNFHWQRGNKIGSGSFGCVYSCVNMNTGQMMAMKEIQFRSDDIQQMKILADEISNIEGIKQENLVEFYGVELHKKEILIFMEFCGDKCTLDHISRESSGLPEELVRSYTNSLLKAVSTLHENLIIHRDIKGQNIFLKTVDNKKTILKLGDFGSSIRFNREGTTISPASQFARGLFGTPSFMAPEVMMSADSNGYTYNADIWSVGCVVIEMFTGKRPWHPIREEHIMFRLLRNQETPPYPQCIQHNAEANDFLSRCLQWDAEKRWSAAKLLNHPFAKFTITGEN